MTFFQCYPKMNFIFADVSGILYNRHVLSGKKKNQFNVTVIEKLEHSQTLHSAIVVINQTESDDTDGSSS